MSNIEPRPSRLRVVVLLAVALVSSASIGRAEFSTVELPTDPGTEIIWVEVELGVWWPDTDAGGWPGQPLISISAGGAVTINPLDGEMSWASQLFPWDWQLSASQVESLMRYLFVEQGFMSLPEVQRIAQQPFRRCGTPLQPRVIISVSTKSDVHAVWAWLPRECVGPGDTPFVSVLQRLLDVTGVELPWCPFDE